MPEAASRARACMSCVRACVSCRSSGMGRAANLKGGGVVLSLFFFSFYSPFLFAAFGS